MKTLGATIILRPELNDFDELLPLLLLKLGRQIKLQEVGGTVGHTVDTSNINLRLRKDKITTFHQNAISNWAHIYNTQTPRGSDIWWAKLSRTISINLGSDDHDMFTQCRVCVDLHSRT